MAVGEAGFPRRPTATGCGAAVPKKPQAEAEGARATLSERARQLLQKAKGTPEPSAPVSPKKPARTGC